MIFVISSIFSYDLLALFPNNKKQIFDEPFVAVLKADKESNNLCITETLSLSEAASRLKIENKKEFQRHFYKSIFIILYFDKEENKLFYSTPEDLLNHLEEKKEYSFNWNPSFLEILEKANRVLIESGDFCISLALWTTTEIIIPGSKILYHGAKEISNWIVYYNQQLNNGFKKDLREN